jgi:hypothetical protein
MTNQQHPITPPPELVVEWADTIYQQTEDDDQRDLYVATRAAQWGADQELEACCDWVEDECPGYGSPYEKLRAARRPKPPSLKEQALAELAEWERICNIAPDSPIRRALEQLDD